MRHLLSSARRSIILLGPAALLLCGCAGEPERINERSDDAVRDPAAMMRIAEAAERGGDLGGAEAFFRRAADLAPGLEAAEIGDARVLAARGDVAQAVARLDEAHARNPGSNEIAGTFGRLLVVANDPGKALVVFDDALQRDPRSSSLHVGRGVALDGLGRHRDAQDAYRAALVINPASEPARKDLALSEAFNGSGDVGRTKRRPVVDPAGTADGTDRS